MPESKTGIIPIDLARLCRGCLGEWGVGWGQSQTPRSSAQPGVGRGEGHVLLCHKVGVEVRLSSMEDISLKDTSINGSWQSCLPTLLGGNGRNADECVVGVLVGRLLLQAGRRRCK
jgi:hypothetical protein